MITLPYIDEEIDLENLEECYEDELQWRGRTVDLDINTDDPSLTADDFKHIHTVLDQLPTYLDTAWKSIITDWENHGPHARSYCEIHKDVYAQLFGPSLTEGDANIDLEKFENALQLSRVGIYPYAPEYYVICDIHFDPDVTNWLLAVALGRDGKTVSIAAES